MYKLIRNLPPEIDFLKLDFYNLFIRIMSDLDLSNTKYKFDNKQSYITNYNINFRIKDVNYDYYCDIFCLKDDYFVLSVHNRKYLIDQYDNLLFIIQKSIEFIPYFADYLKKCIEE